MIRNAYRIVAESLGMRPGSGSDEDGDRRAVTILRGTGTALAGRIVSLLAGVLLLPMTLHHLGAVRYGTWVTLSSVLAWLFLADLGIGNGLTNALSTALGLGQMERARSLISTGFALISMVAATLGLSLLVAWPHVDWASLLNSGAMPRAEVAEMVAIASAMYLLCLPFSLLERVYACCEEAVPANIWAVIDSIGTVCVVAVITRTNASVVLLVIGLVGTRVVVSAASALWLFGWRRRDLAPRWTSLRRESVVQVATIGAQFFAIQVIGIFLFSTDNVIIARVLGATAVTPYSVAWKLFTIPTMLVGLHHAYLWPAYAAARARGDAGWIRRALGWSMASSLALAIALALPLAFFGQEICRRWAGAEAVPEQAVLWWMALWVVLEAPAAAVATMLNGVGQLRGQMLYGALSAAANVGLSIIWARSFGTVGVIAGTVVAYVVFAAGPMSLEAAWTLRRLARDP